MWKIYVGNLDARVKERELADAFNSYGVVRSVWVARKPPGYAFIEFNSRREADDAISSLDGKHGWRVEMSKKSSQGHKSRSSSSESRCRECGSGRHRTKDCWSEAAKRSDRRSSSPRSRTTSTRRSSPGRHRQNRSPRHGHSYDDRRELPRKRERSISPDEVCVKFLRNDLGNPHADECDVPKQHEINTSPDNYRDRSQNDLDDSEEECNMPRKIERHRSPEDYPCRSPQNDQDDAHADNYDTSRLLECDISPEYRSRSQDDQDSSSDECNVPRKRKRNRCPEHYRSIYQNDQGTSRADEKWENCKSPEHQYSRSPEHEGSRSPKINHNGSCADVLSPAREEHSSSRSPLLESSPEC